MFEICLWFRVYKRLQEIIGETLCELGLGKDVLDRAPKALIIKLKEKDKLDFIKIFFKKAFVLQKTQDLLDLCIFISISIYLKMD